MFNNLFTYYIELTEYIDIEYVYIIKAIKTSECSKKKPIVKKQIVLIFLQPFET